MAIVQQEVLGANPTGQYRKCPASFVLNWCAIKIIHSDYRKASECTNRVSGTINAIVIKAVGHSADALKCWWRLPGLELLASYSRQRKNAVEKRSLITYESVVGREVLASEPKRTKREKEAFFLLLFWEAEAETEEKNVQ